MVYMGHDIDYERLPTHIRSGVQTYIERGALPGHFLQAVICNNLSTAFGYADEINRERLHDIVGFFHNEAPGPCWGSVEEMHAWAAQGGLVDPREAERDDARRRYIDTGDRDALKEAINLALEGYAEELRGSSGA